MDTKKVETLKPEVKDEKKLSPEELKNTKGGYGYSIITCPVTGDTNPRSC